MRTLSDSNEKEFPLMLHVNTNVGRVNFHTNTGNKYEAVKRLKEQNADITSCDIHHATLYRN